MCEPTMVPKTARPSENETRTMHQPHRVATIGPGVLVLWCRASGARQHSPVALVVVGGGSHTRGIVVCVRSYETMAAGRHDPTRCVCARSGVFVHLWCAFLCACVRVQTSVPMPRIHTKRWASPSLPLPSGAARTLWCVHGTHTTVRDTARHVSLGLVLHGAVIEKDVVLLVRIVVLLAPDPSLLLLLLGGSVVPRGGRDHPRDRVVRLRRSPAAVARARRRVPRGSVGRDGRRRCGVSGRVPGRRTLGGSTTGAASLGGTRGVGVVVDHRRLVLGVVVGVVVADARIHRNPEGSSSRLPVWWLLLCLLLCLLPWTPRQTIAKRVGFQRMLLLLLLLLLKIPTMAAITSTEDDSSCDSS
mmetsp:Transcript_14135/g.32584  ORF Transcript_14135/g.32584 Transcript_14135/m.32584 type:complete len:359 (+) Transcript_14135:141-1217(+)